VLWVTAVCKKFSRRFFLEWFRNTRKKFDEVCVCVYLCVYQELKLLFHCHWSCSTAKDVFSSLSLVNKIRKSREADIHSAGQEIPYLLWNPQVHYHVHKSPSLVPVLSQMNPIYNLDPFSPEIQFNIILSCMLYVLPILSFFTWSPW
jgi:hypothetical protein